MTRRWSGNRRWASTTGVLTLLALACGTTGTALAQAPPERTAEPFRLVWSSSAGCRSSQIFLGELQGRTALLREAQADEHAITFIVETFHSQTGVRGQLTVRKPDGDFTMREVPGVSCQEVESAMALIAALMVDPLASLERRSLPRVENLAPPSEPPPKPGPPYSLRFEQRLTIRTAIAPDLSWGQSLGVMLAREASWFHPSLGLSAQLADATTTASGGSAELALAAAQLAACPFGAEPNERWDARVCGVFQLGRLRGSGFETAVPATKAILWSSAGMELQVRYRLIGPLWVGWEGAFTFPFSRESFYLEPQQTLHRVPAWGVSCGIGVGLRFF